MKRAIMWLVMGLALGWTVSSWRYNDLQARFEDIGNSILENRSTQMILRNQIAKIEKTMQPPDKWWWTQILPKRERSA